MRRSSARLAPDEPCAEVPEALQARGHELVVEESLAYLVDRLARELTAALGDALRPVGIGPGQWAVLLSLWQRDGLTQAELSRFVAVRPSTMVRTIDRMARAGLVTRTADPSDARFVRIRLTEQGWAVRDEALSRAAAVDEAMLGRLVSRDRQALMRALRRLVGGTSRSSRRPRQR